MSPLVRFQQLFGQKALAVIGMIHLKPLPGSPKSRHSPEELVYLAAKEADIYSTAGVDGVMIENMWDLPYLRSKDIGPEVVAVMTRIGAEVRSIIPKAIPCGIQVLAGGNKEAIAVAKASNLQFIRAESFVFSHVADEGWMDADAGQLLRYRRAIDAEHIMVFADLKKKHSAHAVTMDVPLADTAKGAEFFHADGIILTGTSTGEAANPQELKDVQLAVSLPVLIGSGIKAENVKQFSQANGLIVGSHFKTDNKWSGELEKEQILRFMDSVIQIRD